MKIPNEITERERKLIKLGVIEVAIKEINRTALGIVAAVFKLYPNITFSELKELLPDEINPSASVNFKSIFMPFTEKLYGVVQPISITSEMDKLGFEIDSTHFTNADEIFITGDGVKIIVSKLWESNDKSTGINRLQMLINHIDEYGIKVVDFEKYKTFTLDKYHFEVINTLLFNAISKRKPSKLKFFLHDHPLLVLMANKTELL